jgi:enoyl-CoA hydratase/carnithine racemase
LRSALAWADLLVRLPREALAATKQIVQVAGHLPLGEVNGLEAQLFSKLWAQPDHLEALAAFLDKREARFNGGG